MGYFDVVYVNFKRAAAFQPIDTLAFRLDTSLVSVALASGGTDTVSIADALHVGLSAVFTPVDMLDVFLDVDFPHIREPSFYAVTAGVTLRPLAR